MYSYEYKHVYFYGLGHGDPPDLCPAALDFGKEATDRRREL
jgi:hypothetical protein